MLRVWMIGLVHKDGVWVMVDRNIDRVAGGKLYTCGCTAATCEVVNDKFVKEIGLGFQVSFQFFTSLALILSVQLPALRNYRMSAKYIY